MNLLPDELESVERDLMRVTDMIPKLKTLIFRCKGNQFLSKNLNLHLTDLYNFLAEYQVIIYQEEQKLKEMNADNVLKIVEFRYRWKNIQSEDDSNTYAELNEQLKEDIKDLKIVDHLVYMEPDVFDKIVEKHGLTDIVADYTYVVDLFSFTIK